MKKYILPLLLIGVLVGCKENEQDEVDFVLKTKDSGKTINGYVVYVFEFEGCEYLSTGIGYSQTLTHKGNCKNSIHETK